MILNTISRGDGPVLVLLHGLFGQAGNFGAVQRRLALYSGVTPLLTKFSETADESFDR